MFFWQNWVGIALALYLLKTAKNERFFVATILLFYIAAIFINALEYGINASYIPELSTEQAIRAESIIGLMNFAFVPLLILSCLHLSNNNSNKHKVRFYYIAATSIKSALLTAYAATLFNSNDYTELTAKIEYYWFIPDLLVLILGTTNKITERWKILK